MFLNRKLILSEEGRMEIKMAFLKWMKVSPEVLNYLTTLLNPLTIRIVGQFEGSVFNLMHQGLLEGWCWQTTESCIVFFSLDDYIVRGSLHFSSLEEYEHSWICFSYQNERYVFDPSLNFVVKKEWYDKVFKPLEKSIVYAKTVLEYLVYSILYSNTRQNEKRVFENYDYFMRMLLKEDYETYQKATIIFGDRKDISAPMYRNSTGYEAIMMDGKVRKLVATYYPPSY